MVKWAGWIAIVAVALVWMAGPAAASAVQGCGYEAEVVAVEQKTNTKGETEVTLRFKVLKFERFGHSAGPAICHAPGTETTMEVYNDAEVLRDKLKAGDAIKLERMRVFTHTKDGPRSFTSKTYKGRLNKTP